MTAKLLAVLMAGAWLAASAQADTVLLQKNGRNLQVVSNEKIGPESKKRFSAWRDRQNYFGVLVLNRSKDGAFGSTLGMHTLEQARKDAMAICRAHADQPDDCFEYAYQLPRGYDQTKPGTTIGQSAQKDFVGPYKKRLKPGMFGAFAIDESFNAGWAVNRPDEAAAREQALLACEEGAAKTRARTKANIRKALRLDKRLKCRVVHVSTR